MSYWNDGTLSVWLPDEGDIVLMTAPVDGLTQLPVMPDCGTVSVTVPVRTVFGMPVLEFPVAEFNTSRIWFDDPRAA
jgi:hypothetical protein